MDLILAKPNGDEVGMIRYPVFDCDCNGQRTFSLSVPVSEWDGSITFGSRLFVPGEEYGGIVGEITTDTELGLVTASGHTWRGLLAKKIISPAEGQDYLTVSGTTGEIMLNKLAIAYRFGSVLQPVITEDDAYIDRYQFKRYCTMLDGLNDMLATINQRIDLSYGDEVVNLSAINVKDFSPDIEMSQDYELQFTYDDIRNAPNHLIVGGKGELKNREIQHFYVDRNGNVGRAQYYYGIDEIEEFWENTSSDELAKDSIKHLKEIKNSSKLTMDIESIPDTARIGDIVGGRDYITGQSMKAPISNIILQIKGDIVTKQYKLEEQK